MLSGLCHSWTSLAFTLLCRGGQVAVSISTSHIPGLVQRVTGVGWWCSIACTSHLSWRGFCLHHLLGALSCSIFFSRFNPVDPPCSVPGPRGLGYQGHLLEDVLIEHARMVLMIQHLPIHRFTPRDGHGFHPVLQSTTRLGPGVPKGRQASLPEHPHTVSP